MQQEDVILACSTTANRLENLNISLVENGQGDSMPPHAIQMEEHWGVSVDVGHVENEGLPLHEKYSLSSLETETKLPGKSVLFYKTVTFREIAPLTEFLTDEEIHSVWYDDDEYARIKKEVTATVKKAANGDAIDIDEGWCMRGLEGRTKFGSKKRKNNKAAALEAVWKTQINLWKKKMDNPAVIAAAYKPHGLHAKYPAIQTGHKDARFVDENVRNDWLMKFLSL